MDTIGGYVYVLGHVCLKFYHVFVSLGPPLPIDPIFSSLLAVATSQQNRFACEEELPRIRLFVLFSYFYQNSNLTMLKFEQVIGDYH